MPKRIGGVTYYAEDETARLFQVTVRTVRRWIARDLIESEVVDGTRLFREGVLRQILQVPEGNLFAVVRLGTRELGRLFRVDTNTAQKWCAQGYFGAIQTPGGDYLVVEARVREYIGQPDGGLFADPFLTATEVSTRLGISVRNARYQGETNQIVSIVTPTGGNRLFRTSSVEAYRGAHTRD